MKKLLSIIIFVLCISLATTVYAGRWGRGGHWGGGGHRGGGYYGGHRGYYSHSGGYYGGHGHHGHGGSYNSWAVGINLGGFGYPYYNGYYGGYPYYGYGAPYCGYGYAAAYYAPAPVYYAAAPVYYVQSGHWETQQVWVPGTNQRYWVDQYYDKIRDVWVLGHWEERSGTPGYWTQRHVWVTP